MKKDVNRYETVEIDKLIPYVNNARTHSDEQIKQIQASIREFGFINPVLIDGNFNIIAGHGRVMAAKAEGMDKVPCLFIEHLTDAQKKAYIIADNKLAENAGWDMELLRVELEGLQALDFNMDLIGFDDIELDDLFSANDTEVIEDDFEVELPEEPKSKLGDIYQLGRHRLMCGDSTATQDVQVLMNGKKAHACWTDPPYNVSIGTIKHSKFKQREILNDSMSSADFKIFCEGFVKQIKENVLGCVYIAGPPGADGRIMFGTADEHLHCSTTIIWNKDQFTLGRGKYQSKYEPIWFGWVEDGTRFTNDRTLTNVWDIPRPKKSELHPTMKPLELITRSLEHSTLRTDIVLDLFGGSGSTLIACEQLNRTCYMMELDPKYCDVIINRWEQFTGQKAVLLNE